MTTLTVEAPPQATIILNGTRFGSIELEPTDILDFAEGLVGFEGERRFVLVSAGEGSPFRWLQSLTTPRLSFLLVDPSAFRPDYDPEIPGASAERLEIGPRDPYFLWTTANVPIGAPRSMTLNLAAPIVVNAVTGQGAQIVLDGDAYEVRAAAFIDSSTMTSRSNQEGEAWDKAVVASPGVHKDGAQRKALRAA